MRPGPNEHISYCCEPHLNAQTHARTPTVIGRHLIVSGWLGFSGGPTRLTHNDRSSYPAIETPPHDRDRAARDGAVLVLGFYASAAHSHLM